MSDLYISYSLRELSLRNGIDMEEVWVGYNGYIYDLGNSRLWRKGQHYEHWAGQDLTLVLNDAPHTDRVFDKFKIVGKLKI